MAYFERHNIYFFFTLDPSWGYGMDNGKHMYLLVIIKCFEDNWTISEFHLMIIRKMLFIKVLVLGVNMPKFALPEIANLQLI